ncbi:hypothetical protein ACED56_07555 [Vibrio splendidus]|uniref:hypothetical protein n=1 Tax=Vibrio splendidus TaxID=29497 RepID=UPI00352D189B
MSLDIRVVFIALLQRAVTQSLKNPNSEDLPFLNALRNAIERHIQSKSFSEQAMETIPNTFTLHVSEIDRAAKSLTLSLSDNRILNGEMQNSLVKFRLLLEGKGGLYTKTLGCNCPGNTKCKKRKVSSLAGDKSFCAPQSPNTHNCVVSKLMGLHLGSTQIQWPLRLGKPQGYGYATLLGVSGTDAELRCACGALIKRHSSKLKTVRGCEECTRAKIILVRGEKAPASNSEPLASEHLPIIPITIHSDEAINKTIELVERLLRENEGVERPYDLESFDSKKQFCRKFFNALLPHYKNNTTEYITEEDLFNKVKGRFRYPCTWGYSVYRVEFSKELLLRANQTASDKGLKPLKLEEVDYAEYYGVTNKHYLARFEDGLISSSKDRAAHYNHIISVIAEMRPKTKLHKIEGVDITLVKSDMKREEAEALEIKSIAESRHWAKQNRYINLNTRDGGGLATKMEFGRLTEIVQNYVRQEPNRSITKTVALIRESIDELTPFEDSRLESQVKAETSRQRGPNQKRSRPIASVHNIKTYFSTKSEQTLSKLKSKKVRKDEAVSKIKGVGKKTGDKSVDEIVDILHCTRNVAVVWNHNAQLVSWYLDPQSVPNKLILDQDLMVGLMKGADIKLSGEISRLYNDKHYKEKGSKVNQMDCQMHILTATDDPVTFVRKNGTRIYELGGWLSRYKLDKNKFLEQMIRGLEKST